MMKITNIGIKQAGSYYAKDDYYTRTNDMDNHWFGNLKADLNLSDGVNPKDFKRLINEIDAKANYVTKDAQPAMDFTFSAPKTISVAMALNEGTRRDMIEAHNEAVNIAMHHIQNDVCTRVTSNKITTIVKTGNIIAGEFTHYTSRALDPQLHTHAVVLNMTKYKGKLYAIFNENLYENQSIYRQLYLNSLAAGMMRRGYQIEVTKLEDGFFELSGLVKTIDTFSNRRKEIEDQCKKWGTTTRQAGEKAALITRKSKENKDLNFLIEAWQQTIQEIGGVDLRKESKSLVPDQEQMKADFDRAIEKMTMKKFAFTEQECKKVALTCGVRSGMSIEDFNRFFKEEIGRDLVCLGFRKDAKGDKEIFYVTEKNFRYEQEIYNAVASTKNKMPALSKNEAKKSLDQIIAASNGKLKLSEEQRNAILFLSTNHDQFCVLQGLAGTGKTSYVLDQTREIMERHGYKLFGCCYTGKAANGLEKDAHIPSTTLHSFLNQLEKEARNEMPGQDYRNKTSWNFAGLVPGSGTKEIWICDEASMADNVTMRHLMEAAQIKGARVYFVGDKQQLLPVGVGNAFANLIEHNKIAYVTIEDIQRQSEMELRTGVKEAVQGDIAKTFAILEGRNDIIILPERKERIQAVVDEYASLSQEERGSAVVLVAQNRDRNQINMNIRHELKEKGELQHGKTFITQSADGKVYHREFAEGDKIILLQNDKKLGLNNGQTGFIEKIDGDNLTIRTGNINNQEHLTLNLNEYNFIDHGYSMTAHKAQGVTENRVIVYMDSVQKNLNSRNSFYVDISRAKHDVKIFCDDLKKIKKQVSEFAKKHTSDDFELPKIEKPISTEPPKRFTIESFFGKINDSFDNFKAKCSALYDFNNLESKKQKELEIKVESERQEPHIKVPSKVQVTREKDGPSMGM